MLPSIFYSKKIKVWVLAPYLSTTDENLNYYYDFSQSIAEYTKSFAALQINWIWQPVTMENYEAHINNIVKEKEEGIYFPVVFNICDGDEINGTPGISVVKLLHKKKLVYTGANEYFYHITTSKIPMKEAFDKHHVPNAQWQAIAHKEKYTNAIFKKLGSPLIVKPSVSGGSMGVGIKNVVENIAQLNHQITKMFEGYRGWNLASHGLIAESFIAGPEFTVLIVGSYNKPHEAKIYTPVQRIFHASLPEKEKFLSFDRLWEIYEEESPMPNNANFYEYALLDEALIEPLKKISWNAYAACKGTGYTRVDVRMDSTTKKLYVLEVNAQCGLSEDEDYTSIGAILKFSHKTFAQLLIEIITEAFERHPKMQPA